MSQMHQEDQTPADIHHGKPLSLRNMFVCPRGLSTSIYTLSALTPFADLRPLPREADGQT